MVPPAREIPSAERERVATLRALDLLDAPANERFERVVDAAQQEFGVPIACIMLVDHERQWMAAGRGPLPQETSTDGSICRTAQWSPETFVVPDTMLEPRFATSPYVVGDPHLRFYAAQPLYAPTGEPVGTLCVMDTEARELEYDQVRSLAELGRWAQHEIFAAVGQEPTPEVRERLERRDPADTYALLSLPAPATERTDARFYDWSPVPHGLLLGVGGVQTPDGRSALAATVVRSALRGAQVDLDPGIALEVARQQAVTDLAAMDATAEFFLARLDTTDGRLDHVARGRSLAVVLHADGSWDRLGGRPAAVPVGPTPDGPPRVSLSDRGRAAAQRARSALTGHRSADATQVVDLAQGPGAPAPAGSIRLRDHDTLICGSQEWADLDDAALDTLAALAPAATLRELRSQLQELQQLRGLTGACGLLLRHERDPA